MMEKSGRQGRTIMSLRKLTRTEKHVFPDFGNYSSFMTFPKLLY